MKVLRILFVAALILVPLAISMVPGTPPHGYGHVLLVLPVLAWFRWPRQRKRVALFVLAVVLQTLAFPDPDLGFLGWVLLWPYLLAREQDDGAVWWRAAFFFGFLRAHAGYYWLGHVHFTAWFTVSVASGLLFTLLFEGLLRWGRAIPFALRAATGWVLFEWAHSWFLGGFPWLQLGHTQYRASAVLQCADIAGPYGVSFLVAFVSVAAYRIVRTRRRGYEPLAAAVLLIAALGYGLTRSRPEFPESGPGVLMVQSAVPHSVKHGGIRPGELYALLRRLTREGLAEHPETKLIVWPETMYPWPLIETLPVERSEFHVQVKRAARSLKRPVIYGASTFRTMEAYRKYRSLNSTVLVDAAGDVQGIYSKQELVPMGEEFLARRYFSEEYCDGAFDWLVRNLGYPRACDLARGDRFVTLDAGKGLRCANLICFEGLYAHIAREAVLTDEPDLILCLINNGWFGDAVETRTPLFNCTNAGITCAIDPFGRILGQVDRVMEEGFLYAEVPARWPKPLFLRGGHWILPFGLGLLALGFFLRARIGSRGLSNEDV